MSAGHILLIDDDDGMRHSTAQALELAGLSVTALARAEDALALLGPGFNGAVVSDIRMPEMDGMALLAAAHAMDGDIPVILFTGHADVQLAVEAMRRGAYDFIEKPFRVQDLATVLRRACDHRALVIDNRRLRAVAGKRDDIEARLPGRSQSMVDLRALVRAIGASDADALVVGPTGSGKEVVARALHDLSARAGKPFIAIDCLALPEQLFESELFGHEAGAFAGALRPRYGKFEHARGGTVLLDEIGSMPIDMQARLLRVLQDRTISRLGSNEQITLDLRFIATSKADLRAAVTERRFREDLFWRLNVAVLHVPALATRREDIPLLFQQLVRESAARHGLTEMPVAAGRLAALAARDWPGNVRELRNSAERFVLGLDPFDPTSGSVRPASNRLADRMADYERSLIAGAISAHGGKLKAVYESLGIGRKTLYEKMQRHGLDRHLILDSSEDAAE
jgi:two-component system C4-dicarboxylate transport response regulator DctD